MLSASQGIRRPCLPRRPRPADPKGGGTWNREFGKNLLKLRKLSPKFSGGYVIYSGELTPEVDGVKFLNFKNTAAAPV